MKPSQVLTAAEVADVCLNWEWGTEWRGGPTTRNGLSGAGSDVELSYIGDDDSDSKVAPTNRQK